MSIFYFWSLALLLISLYILSFLEVDFVLVPAEIIQVCSKKLHNFKDFSILFHKHEKIYFSRFSDENEEVFNDIISNAIFQHHRNFRDFSNKCWIELIWWWTFQIRKRDHVTLKSIFCTYKLTIMIKVLMKIQATNM